MASYIVSEDFCLWLSKYQYSPEYLTLSDQVNNNYKKVMNNFCNVVQVVVVNDNHMIFLNDEGKLIGVNSTYPDGTVLDIETDIKIIKATAQNYIYKSDYYVFVLLESGDTLDFNMSKDPFRPSNLRTTTMKDIKDFFVIKAKITTIDKSGLVKYWDSTKQLSETAFVSANIVIDGLKFYRVNANCRHPADATIEHLCTAPKPMIDCIYSDTEYMKPYLLTIDKDMALWSCSGSTPEKYKFRKVKSPFKFKRFLFKNESELAAANDNSVQTQYVEDIDCNIHTIFIKKFRQSVKSTLNTVFKLPVKHI